MSKKENQPRPLGAIKPPPPPPPPKNKPRGRPIRPGERLALKPEGERADAHIVLRVTRAQKAILVKSAQARRQTLKDYLLNPTHVLFENRAASPDEVKRYLDAGGKKETENGIEYHSVEGGLVAPDLKGFQIFIDGDLKIKEWLPL